MTQAPTSLDRPAQQRTEVLAVDVQVDLLGHAFAPLTERQTIAQVIASLDHDTGGWIVTANLDHLRRLTRDRKYAATCDQASLVVADGMPLLWAAKLQGTPLPERVAGSNLVLSLSAAAGKNNRSLYLLGGTPGTAERAAVKLKQDYPDLRIAGTDCPPIGFEHNPDQLSQIRDKLLAAAPDIIYVALGSPKQEYLIEQLRNDLPHAWWIGVGISFSFICGEVKRAPKWLQSLGLEWMHRLVQEPQRLAKRYLVHGVPFAAWLLIRSALRRDAGQPAAGTRRGA